jgi:hypothetical protein
VSQTNPLRLDRDECASFQVEAALRYDSFEQGGESVGTQAFDSDPDHRWLDCAAQGHLGVKIGVESDDDPIL